MYSRDLNEIEKKQLTDLLQKLNNNKRYYAGFPPNIHFDYTELYPFLSYSINNLGDPFTAYNPHSTHLIEREVLNYFAKIYKAPGNFGGYVTNGGTEGNLYGLYLARNIFPTGMVYFSEHTHYSNAKNLNILQMSFQKVAVQQHGEMDYFDLEQQLKLNASKPAIIFATLGTTVLGAIDNIHLIKRALHNAGIKDYYIHADAAFSGMVLPFVNDPQPYQFPDGIDSIAISGHKLIGSPIPCGVVIAKGSLIENILGDVPYAPGHKSDSTLSGSRNGITPLFLWYAIKRYGDEGFKQLIAEGFAKVEKVINQFKQHDIDAWSNKNSMMIVIPKLTDNLLKKWCVPSGFGYSSLTALPKLTDKMVDEIIKDIMHSS